MGALGSVDACNADGDLVLLAVIYFERGKHKIKTWEKRIVWFQFSRPFCRDLLFFSSGCFLCCSSFRDSDHEIHGSREILFLFLSSLFRLLFCRFFSTRYTRILFDHHKP